MSKDKKKSLNVLKKIQSDSHRTRTSEPFEAVFRDIIIDIYNEYVACVALTEYSSISSIKSYEVLSRYLAEKGMRKESIARIYDVIEQEINKIADDDAKILNTIKKDGDVGT